MKKRFLLVSVLGLLGIHCNAANYVTPGDVYVSITGDGNSLVFSPYGTVSGYNNYVYDAHGNFSDSTDAVKVFGSENTLGTGKSNSTFGNSNAVVGAVNSNSTHLMGNDNNITNSAQSNVIGNNNQIQGNNNVAIGNGNTITGNGNSIAIGGGTASNGGIAIGSGSSAITNEVNFGDSKQLTGVKAGIVETDVVNVGQTNQKFTNTLDEANRYTDNTLNSAKNISNQYTDQKIYDFLNDSTLNFATDYANNRFNQLNKKLDKARKEVNAGISSAIASASVPHKLGKTFSYGVGLGSYKDEFAYAIGIKWGISKSMALASAVSFNTQSDSSLSMSFAYGF